MTELDQNALALLDQARSHHDPAPGAEQRVRAALASALQGGALPATIEPGDAASSVVHTAAAGGVAAKLVAGGLIVGAAGFGAGYVTGKAEAPPPATSAIPAAPSALQAPAPVAPSADLAEPAVLPAEKSEEPVKAPAHASAPSPAYSTDTHPNRSRLDEEVLLLRRAQRSLRDGYPDESLEILNRMDTELTGGVLQEERAVARVLALCESGEIRQAKQAAERFLAAYPSSVHGARIRTSCAFASSDGKSQ